MTTNVSLVPLTGGAIEVWINGELATIFQGWKQFIHGAPGWLFFVDHLYVYIPQVA